MNKDTLNDRYCDYNNFRRARYFHGMLMTDRDFREEQLYHIEKRKMLNRTLHGWGVVCGLGITGKIGGSTITIGPGVALDCHGNEIVICDPYSIDLTSNPCMGTPHKKPVTAKDCQQKEDVKKSNISYICIRYNEVPTDPVPAYAPGGGCEEKACDNSRIREGFCIKTFDTLPCQPKIPGIDPSLIKRIIDNCKGKFGIVLTGRVVNATEDTIQFNNASNQQNFYNGMQITITSGSGSGQTRTINAYDGGKNIATVDEPWGTVPDETSAYSIANKKCLPETLKEFSAVFCTTPPACPDCCPDEHYIILGKVEMNTGKTIINTISNDDRSYVMTANLFKYIFSSLLNGLEELYPNKDIELPDINMIHTNPIQALCWITQIMLSNASKMASQEVPVKEMILKSYIPEFHDLKQEVANLKKTIDTMQKKPGKK